MNVQKLLDFIGQIEANGNYNAVYGNARSTRDLSALTLNEVLEEQRQKIADGRQSATGKYQFIRATLQGLRDEMRLSGQEKFTPDLQDKLATRLLERRGLKNWIGGRISDRQFANNLAREWASLPVIETGRSYYAGDGLNKSLTTPDDVLACLADVAEAPVPDTSLPPLAPLSKPEKVAAPAARWPAWFWRIFG